MTSRSWDRPLLEISTILDADERAAVDAAGAGVYHAVHRGCADEVVEDIRTRKTQAVLLSVGCCYSQEWHKLARMIREAPHVPAVALFKGQPSRVAGALLELGHGGVNSVVDVNSADGWVRLRRLLSQECADVVERALQERIVEAAGDMTGECGTFFRTLVKTSREISSVRRLAGRLHILPSTLMSRFFRAGLPAPKRYLTVARLVRAAYLFENAGFSIANVANHLEFSSPQSFGRHIRAVVGTTALRFRTKVRGEEMAGRFVDELIVPYRHILRQFYPITLQQPRGKDWLDQEHRT